MTRFQQGLEAAAIEVEYQAQGCSAPMRDCADYFAAQIRELIKNSSKKKSK